MIEAAAAQQSFRIQPAINEFLNNALSLEPGCAGLVRHDPAVDPELGPDLHHDANPLYVVRTGLLRDTSPLYVKTVRMTTVGQR